MMMNGRSIAFFLACVLALVPASPVHPSYGSDARRLYETASRRLTDVRTSPEKNKYRSYWVDCIRAFERVEKKYGKSRFASDACFDRAETYRDLYLHSRYEKDIDKSLQAYRTCQAFYPRHRRAPEALYRIIDISLGYKKDEDRAADVYAQLSKSYPGSRWTATAKTRLKRAKPHIAGKQRRAPSEAKSGKPVPGGLVEKIRYHSSGDFTRVVIDYERKMDFQVLELKDPPRLVFDLLNAQLGPQVDTDPLTVNDGILRQVRASQFAPHTVRVVLDLASINSYAAFPLREPQRLVIDVAGEAAKGQEIPADPGGSAGQEQPIASAQGTAGASGAEKPSTGTPPAVSASAASSRDGFSLSRQLGLKVRTIAIDAGHGGHDPGAVGRQGTKEKNITLDISKRLAVLLKEGLNCNVVMTREKDVFIPLEDRPAIARTKGADLFISIHVNANRKRKAKGIETYIQGLSASDLDSMETASRENATSGKTIRELDDELTKILTGLRMVSNDEDSIHLAHAVQTSLVDAVKPLQRQVADLGVKRAFFYVLINTGMPSILAEVGFISNPVEEVLLRKKSYRQAIAEALYKALKHYVESRGGASPTRSASRESRL